MRTTKCTRWDVGVPELSSLDGSSGRLDVHQAERLEEMVENALASWLGLAKCTQNSGCPYLLMVSVLFQCSLDSFKISSNDIKILLITNSDNDLIDISGKFSFVARHVWFDPLVPCIFSSLNELKRVSAKCKVFFFWSSSVRLQHFSPVWRSKLQKVCGKGKVKYETSILENYHYRHQLGDFFSSNHSSISYLDSCIDQTIIPVRCIWYFTFFY